MHRNDYVNYNMQSKIINLKSILSYRGLSSGYSFRGKIKHIHNGGVRVIQLKDFEDNSKGTNNFALVFKEIDNIPTIASSAIFVIKVDRNKANPDFVAWYINQSKVQNYFKTNEAGTYSTSINKTTLEETPIVLPELEVQNNIAKIANLHNQELALSNKLIELKNKLTTTQLLNIL